MSKQTKNPPAIPFLMESANLYKEKAVIRETGFDAQDIDEILEWNIEDNRKGAFNYIEIGMTYNFNYYVWCCGYSVDRAGRATDEYNNVFVYTDLNDAKGAYRRAKAA